VANVNQHAYILRNNGGNGKGWIGVEAPIGARVRVGQQYYEVQTAVGYQSASDARLIIGLGSEASARLVEIQMLGKTQRFENVKSGRRLTWKK
jgi:hypothetical protein